MPHTTEENLEARVDHRAWTEEDIEEFEARVARKRAARGYVPPKADEVYLSPVETLPNGVKLQRELRRAPVCTES